MSATRAHHWPVNAARGLALGAVNWRRLLWATPALLAFAYLIVLWADFHQVITAINMHGDVVIAPVLGKLAGQGPAGTQVLLGHHPWYEEYLFLRATSGLSFYRPLWLVAPMLWTLLGFGVLGWAAWRALGSGAALLTVSAVICLGSLGRFIFFAFNWHGLTVLHTILTVAALVWLAPRAAEISWARLCAIAVGLGVFNALPMASDALFPFWALIPMCAAAGVIAYRSAGRARWTPPAFALLTLLVSVVGGKVIDHLVTNSGVTTIPFPYTFVGSLKGALDNFGELLDGWMNLGGGGFFGMSLNLRGFASLASGLFILAALGIGVWQVGRLVRGRRAGKNAASADVLSAADSPRLAYVTFWATSLVLQAAVFVGTSVPKIKTGSIRYALAGYIAIMALMPLVARRRPAWRIALTAGVCVFALSAIFLLARRPYDPYGPFPGPPQAQMVLRFARAHHVAYGYASYWDAPDLTWLTNYRLQIYPVKTGCGPWGLCPDHARINTWYAPRPGTRSMLIADSAQTPIRSIPPGFGRPVAVGHVGSLTLAVYDYDVASRL